jgi:hypothetical protein
MRLPDHPSSDSVPWALSHPRVSPCVLGRKRRSLSVTFGNGGGATLNVGLDGPASFDGKAVFSAGGSGNTYHQGTFFVVFQPGQPERHNI